jgi:hypothetical protein
MKELSQNQTQHLLNRLPNVELSYETLSHKKVFNNYDIGVAIPSGKKYYAWFSFYYEKDVCFLMELNRDKKIIKVTIVETLYSPCLSKGTLLYGTLVPMNDKTDDITLTTSIDKSYFVIEDLLTYQGISMKGLMYGDKLGYINDMFTNFIVMKESVDANVIFTLPVMWSIKDPQKPELNEIDIFNYYDVYKTVIGYQAHHIQLRKLMEVSPFVNITITAMTSVVQQFIMSKNKPVDVTTTANPNISLRKSIIPQYTIDLHKPQYKYLCVFQVLADIQYDIYHLYACGKNKTMVYYNVACIPTIKCSVLMNNIFRNIRENKNIDYIEESDDEDDFQDIREDKYVKLDKTVLMECVFNMKFKKWIPMRIVDNNSKIVHISKLVYNYSISDNSM